MLQRTLLFSLVLLALAAPVPVSADNTQAAFPFTIGHKIKFGEMLSQAKYILFYNSTESQEKGLLFSIEVKMKSAGTDQVLDDGVIQQIISGVQQSGLVNHVLREAIKFMWGDVQQHPIGDYSKDLSDFLLEGESPPNQTPNAETAKQEGAQEGKSYPTQADAREALKKEIMNDAAQRGAGRYVIIIFDEDLMPRDVWPERSSVGDLIYVGVIQEANKGLLYFNVEFAPCHLEPEAPQLYIGDTKFLSSLEAKKIEYGAILFPPRTCFDSTVEVRVKGGKDKNNITAEGIYSLRQYSRYRGTLQLGVLFTDQHNVSFGLKTDNQKKYIYNKGPMDSGPEYSASLVIYSFFRYIQELFSGRSHFSGRDIVNEQTFLDRLGAVIGVGLKSPFDRFVLGLSFEIAYGINLVGAVDFAKLSELGAGLAEGAEYSGTEDSIPIHRFWSTKFVFGLSLDLRYVTALFSRQ
jgi:hypothetical protein